MSDVYTPTPEEQRLSDQAHAVYEDVVPIVKESKSGYKTTEFWTMVLGAVLINVNAIPMPDRYQGFVTAGLAALYALSRGLAKLGQPVVEPDKVETKV